MGGSAGNQSRELRVRPLPVDTRAGPQGSGCGAATSHSPTNEPETPQTRLQTLREIFELCDIDGNGRINKRELIKVLRRSTRTAEFFGLPGTIRQEDGSRTLLEEWFQRVDINESRDIDWDEFCKFYVQCRRAAASVFSPRPVTKAL